MNENSINCGYYQPMPKKGYTTTDFIIIGISVTLMITYIILISTFPFDSYLSDNKNSDINNKLILINSIGFLIGLLVSYFISNTILREYEINIYVNVIVFITSLVLIITYYVSVYNPERSSDWVKYNYTIIPLLSSLFFMCQYSFTRILSYINKKYQFIDVRTNAPDIPDIFDDEKAYNPLLKYYSRNKKFKVNKFLEEDID